MAIFKSEEPQTRRKPTVAAALNQAVENGIKLLKAELAVFKAKLIEKVTTAAIGIGLLIGAAILALYGLGFFFYFLVNLLEIWLQPWAASLIVTGFIFLLVGILAGVGVRSLKKLAKKPTPEGTGEDE